MPVPASSYNDLIPQPGDQLSVSQSDLLNNFGAIKTLIDVDHVDFANVNAGQHNKVTFPVQALAPAFAAGSLGLFNFLTVALPALPVPPNPLSNQLYFNRNDGTQIPITAASATVGADGFSYLPSGVLLKWGNRPTIGGANVLTIGPVNPPFSGVLAVYITTRTNPATDSFVQLVSFTNTTITVNSTQRTTTANSASGCDYLVIGY